MVGRVVQRQDALMAEYRFVRIDCRFRDPYENWPHYLPTNLQFYRPPSAPRFCSDPTKIFPLFLFFFLGKNSDQEFASFELMRNAL